MKQNAWPWFKSSYPNDLGLGRGLVKRPCTTWQSQNTVSRQENAGKACPTCPEGHCGLVDDVPDDAPDAPEPRVSFSI